VKILSYKELQNCRNKVNLENFELAWKETNKAISEANSKAYEDLYKKLEIKQG